MTQDMQLHGERLKTLLNAGTVELFVQGAGQRISKTTRSLTPREVASLKEEISRIDELVKTRQYVEWAADVLNTTAIRL